MPGRAFESAADFNTQFTDWLGRANSRVVRTTKSSPVDRLDADRAAMLALPPIPLHLGWRNKIRLGRDYYVRLDTNDYSVDPTVIGRLVMCLLTWTGCGSALTVVSSRSTGGSGLVARRSLIRRMSGPRRLLRKQFQQPRPPADGDGDLVRDLADYDRAFGLTGDGQPI